MGTNYYVTYNQCAHCRRGTELHVGKSGTVVRAHPDLGIRSWADWVRLLGAVDHTCRDEYGDELTGPPESLVGRWAVKLRRA